MLKMENTFACVIIIAINRIAYCDISKHALSEMAKKLPALESLEELE